MNAKYMERYKALCMITSVDWTLLRSELMRFEITSQYENGFKHVER